VAYVFVWIAVQRVPDLPLRICLASPRRQRHWRVQVCRFNRLVDSRQRR
jgi:hypothetical protein